MPEPLLVRHGKGITNDFRDLVTERLEIESRGQTGAAALLEEARAAHAAAVSKSESDERAALAKAQADFEQTQEACDIRFRSRLEQAEENLSKTTELATSRHETSTQELEENHLHAVTEVAAMYDMHKSGPEKEVQDARAKTNEAIEKVAKLQNDARIWFKSCRQDLNRLASYSGQAQELPPLIASSLGDYVKVAEDTLSEMRHSGILKMFRGVQPVGIFLLVGVLAAAPCGYALNWSLLTVPVVAGIMLVGGSLLLLILRWMSNRRAAQLYVQLEQSSQGVHKAAAWLMQQVEDRLRSELSAAKEKQQASNAKAERKRRKKLSELTESRDLAVENAHCVYQDEMAASEAEYQSRCAQIKQTHQQALDAAEQAHRRATDNANSDWARAQDSANEMLTQAAESARRLWDQGLGKIQVYLKEVHRESNRLFPDWKSEVWKDWTPNLLIPPAVRYGEFAISPKIVPGGEALVSNADSLNTWLPALLEFPFRASLVIDASGEGSKAAISTLQAVMLRLLTSIPPGKLKFTIVDAISLGENFSAFMHLADTDESLVSRKIWTEPRHIEERLTDLTEQMETIIQKYLRNEFKTIAEYNEQAGEIAEPLRVLVISNFPTGFSEASARRLTSILATGPRCGVHVLMSVDRNQPCTYQYSLDEMSEHAVRLEWSPEGFVCKAPANHQALPLTVDQPPDPETCTALIRMVASRVKDATRVEVPFDRIAPTWDKVWTTTSEKQFQVPLGPSGATRVQQFTLGRGTAQHALIAGKTGSGKSSLLHCLITSAALVYGPDELQLYLVDFKKGVEFKTYAAHRLPHAKVIAIESEREFGLSVLQRLDLELKERGELFRRLGVQDLAGYRKAAPDQKVPRILLIVDEFQEWFVEDDRISQEVSLLLDRLVRQGRAFGIHVVLGSQTLGGAYSLARSTIGQMAVRIALQCSEADAHLVLSEENTAARLLSRPGEAIYNDAGGLSDANSPFQVAWLSDTTRDRYLNRISQLMQDHKMPARNDCVVFEGNAAMDIQVNQTLEQLLARPTEPAEPNVAQVFVGEPVAIRPSSTAPLRTQGGSNLLAIGQNAEAALAFLAVNLVGLVAQHPTLPSGKPRIYVLDGSLPESTHAWLLPRLAAQLGGQVRFGRWRECGEFMNELAVELERRQQFVDEENPALFLLVHELGRFRDLRRKEDDFSFSRSADSKPDPATQFAQLLREGAAAGIHTLCWCDTLNAMHRTLDRSLTREFDQRLLFQMSGADSSVLIDSPAASRLGLHRAILFSTDADQVEKCRPYAIPDAAWVDRVTSQLASRTPQATQTKLPTG